MWTLNAVQTMWILVLTWNAWPDSRWKESGYSYAKLEERWSASVSSLAWGATTSTKHKFCWCSHTWTRGTGPGFLVVLLPCSLLCSFPSPHEGKLEKGDPTDQGHYQQSTSSENSYKKCCPVRTLARVDSVGGKFRNTGVDHKKKQKLVPHGNNPLYDSALKVILQGLQHSVCQVS